MQFDPERVRKNAREATTEDLLDRITVYREGMEPQAVDIIENELIDRGLAAEDVRLHQARRLEQPLIYRDGFPAECSFCERPAVAEAWRWHLGWGRWIPIPIYRPRHFYYCVEHLPQL
jgi:hypothetical protein